MKFPRHKLLIRDVLYDLGNNFNIEQDLDIIYTSMSFSLPYVDKGSWSTANIRKYDVVKLYYKEFDSLRDAEVADINNMSVEFFGYVDQLSLSEDKGTGLKYQIQCKSLAGLLFEKTTVVPIAQQDLIGLMEEAQRLLGPTLLPSYEVAGFSRIFIPKLDSKNFFGEMLNELKEKYAIQVFQRGNGTLVVTTPAYFNTQQNITVYDLTKNIFASDYGNITQNIDSVLVLGTNAVGFAVDPIAMQLKLGVLPENIDVNFLPTREQCNPLILERRDVFDSETAQSIARNKLIESARNYNVTIDVPYKEGQNVGDILTIINSKVISPTQKWIIKKRSVIISKTDIKTKLILYSNSISDFPDDILRDSTGILDTDILNITEKVEDVFLIPQ